MSLPQSRNRTYDPTSPVRSADLNDLQDCIIGGKMPGQWESVFPAGVTESNILPSYGGGYAYPDSGAGTMYRVPVQLREGVRVTDIGVRAYGAGGAGAPLDVRLRRYNGDGTATVVGTVSVATPPAAWATYVNAITPFALGEGQSLSFEVDLPTGSRIAAFRFKRDVL